MRRKQKRGDTLRKGGNKAASQKGAKSLIARDAASRSSLDYWRGGGSRRG